MSKQQMIENLVSTAPESKLDIILAFIKFILKDGTEPGNSILSEPALAKDWLSDEEEEAWKDL